MLPSFLYPSYKQYKADSDAIATWLANTARACGYQDDHPTEPSAPPPTAPKLKGRARKLAREAAKKISIGNKSSAPTTNSGGDSAKYSLSVKDFVCLAEWIAKSKKPIVKVPEGFVSILDRAIATRKRHQSWWYKQTGDQKNVLEDNSANQDGHNHFIHILEEVRKILEPRMPPARVREGTILRSPGTSQQHEVDGSQFVNLFEGLNVEETSEAFLNFVPMQNNRDKPQATNASYTLRTEQSLQEACFAFYCLLNDLDNIRRYLQQVWNDYKRGACELVPASVVTNTAVGFARQLQQDFTHDFPQHVDFEELINLIYNHSCLAVGEHPGFKERPTDEMNFVIYEAADRILLPVVMVMSSFVNSVSPGELPINVPGRYDTFDPSSDRTKKSSRDKFGEDRDLLFEILPDFYILALCGSNIVAEDEMIRGLREAMKTKEVPVWLAFAAQVFLDIIHTLREQVDNGYHDLVKNAHHVEDSIQQVLKFHENLRISTWPKTRDRCLHNLLSVINDWVWTDMVATTRGDVLRPSSDPSRPTGSFLLLRRHPLYCGLLSFCIRIQAQDLGIRFANAWGSIIYTAHLYNALRQEKLLSNIWQDMNLAMLIHKREDMFVGPPPTNIEGYWKRWFLASGCSIKNFAMNKRSRAPSESVTYSKAGSRCLNKLSPVSYKFRNRYCHGIGGTEFTPDDIDTIVELSSETNVLGSDGTEWHNPRIQIDAAAGAAPGRGVKPAGPDQNTRSKRSIASTVRTIQLLDNLLNAIQSEMLDLSFDHFRLHILSWRLLRALQRTLGPGLKEIVSVDYSQHEYLLPFVVGATFLTAFKTKQSTAASVLNQTGVATSDVLVKAADVVKTMLESDAGAVGIAMLKEESGLDVEADDFWETAGPSVGVEKRVRFRSVRWQG